MNNIITLFIELGGWSWLILGGALLLIEVLAPGVFMLWFGLAAMLTGAITLAFPISFQLQLIIFAVASLISVLISRRFFTNNLSETDQPHLNKRGDQLIGKTFPVTTAIEQGHGKIKVGDTVWSVVGPDTKIGEEVRVTAIDGNRLTVESL